MRLEVRRLPVWVLNAPQGQHIRAPALLCEKWRRCCGLIYSLTLRRELSYEWHR